MRSTTVVIGCPKRDCDDGEITVEVSGARRAARGYDPPEGVEMLAIASTCGHHVGDIESHPRFAEYVNEALYDKDS